MARRRTLAAAQEQGPCDPSLDQVVVGVVAFLCGNHRKDQPPTTCRRFVAVLAIAALVATMPGCSGCIQQSDEPPVPSIQADEAAESSRNSADASEPANGNKQDNGTKASGQAAADDSANSDGGSSTGSLGTVPDAAGSRPGSGRTAGSPAPSPKRSPGEAAKHARDLKTRAQEAAARGKHAQAFEAALEAWQSVAAHPGDAACAQLTKDLESLLKSYGEAANRGTSRVGEDKPIVVQ